jgi:beta-phosphoglucomutase-like phosphatase (HAD superfamily)
MNTSCAILWDLDGVIVDSADLHFQSFKIVMKNHGYDFSYSSFLKSFGRNNDSVLEEAIGKKPDEALKNEVNIQKEEWFCQHIPGNMKLFPGAADWLNWFTAHHIPQAIASSAPMENISLSLNEFHLGNYFDAVVSGNRIIAKPDPKVFLRAAAVLETSPKRCIVFEDSIAGMQGALAAGMRCITVATTHPITEFSQATLSLNRLTDLSEKQILTLLDD